MRACHIPVLAAGGDGTHRARVSIPHLGRKSPCTKLVSARRQALSACSFLTSVALPYHVNRKGATWADPRSSPSLSLSLLASPLLSSQVHRAEDLSPPCALLAHSPSSPFRDSTANQLSLSGWGGGASLGRWGTWQSPLGVQPAAL